MAKGVTAIARQNRDVVAFCRVQVNLAREHLRLLPRGRLANTVAEVAYCRTVHASGWVNECLPKLAGDSADAARRNHGHVAGMEIGADAGSRECRTTCRSRG